MIIISAEKIKDIGKAVWVLDIEGTLPEDEVESFTNAIITNVGLSEITIKEIDIATANALFYAISENSNIKTLTITHMTDEIAECFCEVVNAQMLVNINYIDFKANTLTPAISEKTREFLSTRVQKINGIQSKEQTHNIESVPQLPSTTLIDLSAKLPPEEMAIETTNITDIIDPIFKNDEKLTTSSLKNTTSNKRPIELHSPLTSFSDNEEDENEAVDGTFNQTEYPNKKANVPPPTFFKNYFQGFKDTFLIDEEKFPQKEKFKQYASLKLSIPLAQMRIEKLKKQIKYREGILTSLQKDGQAKSDSEPNSTSDTSLKSVRS